MVHMILIQCVAGRGSECEIWMRNAEGFWVERNGNKCFTNRETNKQTNSHTQSLYTYTHTHTFTIHLSIWINKTVAGCAITASTTRFHSHWRLPLRQQYFIIFYVLFYIKYLVQTQWLFNGVKFKCKKDIVWKIFLKNVIKLYIFQICFWTLFM